MTGEANGVSVAERAVAGANAVPAIPLVVEHVSKSYDVDGRVVPVIGDLSLTLESGQIVSIVGPSGCGKTTLLNTLCGLLTPDSGRISWYGQAITDSSVVLPQPEGPTIRDIWPAYTSQSTP